MSAPCFIIDAFTHSPFGGNPAAVVILEQPQSESWLQSVAAEFNLSETAFLLHENDNRWNLRWLTPKAEVDLCGHGTLAATKALSQFIQPDYQRFEFTTRSGLLTARVEGKKITLNFPTSTLTPINVDQSMLNKLTITPSEYLSTGNKLLLRVESEQVVREFSPNPDVIAGIADEGVFITAPADAGDVDFVSRFFAPNIGINEDPVTGAIHCALAPYWAEKLNKTTLNAVQCSERTGHLQLQLLGDRVEIAGEATVFMQGSLHV